jgi:hypothetical protein
MEREDTSYRKITINTQPLLIPLGFYVITYDRNIANHFILGTAVWTNSSKLSIFSNDNSKYFLIGGTVGLAYFPWSKESIGWHIAGYVTPGYKWEVNNSLKEEAPIIYSGSYLGYSFVCLKRIKLSLNAGAMYNYSFKVSDESQEDKGFTPTLMLETGVMF